MVPIAITTKNTLCTVSCLCTIISPTLNKGSINKPLSEF